MRTLSLFSGIGGLDLGLERAGFQIVAQCEADPYCRAVLAKHWPGVPCHDDVRTLDPLKFGPIDAIVGGFPCQDVSNAGKRAGISAARSGLYRELVRCIRVARPRYAILENVAALLVRGMGEVLGDLAEVGYDAEWNCVSACSVGAPHCRNRLFIAATDSERNKQWREKPRCWTFGRMGRKLESFPWNGSWEAALAKFRGVDDGISRSVERTDALRNAVVPQVAEWIGYRIIESTRIQNARYE